MDETIATLRRTSRDPASSLLRLATAGSVDDGKSTLIGRLFHDAKGIFEDQFAALERDSRRRGRDGVDLSLLTDGLRAEREQGITIDVAYRYFATPARRFVIADTPGHVQYTRNMVTGCSTADLALVLIDARHGIVEQTRRHIAIAALLGVPHLVGCVNKMDLVGWDAAVFDAIRDGLAELTRRLGVCETTAIPVSALLGDNVVDRSAAMPWYDGPSLLEHLESAAPALGHDLAQLRLPVQWVIRGAPDLPDYRAYAGRLEAGVLRPGDEVVVLPSGVRTRIDAIDTFDGPLDEATPPASVAVRLEDAVDLSRGGLLVDSEHVPRARRELDALVCWLDDTPLRPGGRYLLKHLTRTVRAVPEAVNHRIDVTTFERLEGAGTLHANEIGTIRLRVAEPVFADPYRESRATGSAILIDEATNATVAAILVTDGEDWP